MDTTAFAAFAIFFFVLEVVGFAVSPFNLEFQGRGLWNQELGPDQLIGWGAD